MIIIVIIKSVQALMPKATATIELCFLLGSSIAWLWDCSSRYKLWQTNYTVARRTDWTNWLHRLVPAVVPCNRSPSEANSRMTRIMDSS